MESKFRSVDAPEEIPFTCDANFLRNVDLLNPMIRFGDLDISFHPSGTSGYEDLERTATRFDLERLLVPVASLADVIRSKESANREKDRQALPTLRALLERSRLHD